MGDDMLHFGAGRTRMIKYCAEYYSTFFCYAGRERMLSNGFNLYPVTPYQYGTGISNHDTLSTTETSKSLMDKVWQQVGKSDLP